jgi:multiple antibiotic resistance protein
MIKDFLLTFVPLFVAVDAIGVLPIFINLTTGIKLKDRRRIIFQSVITAWLLAFGFIFLGKWVFNLLGITVNDFMIAGGIVLFIISVNDILNPTKKRTVPARELGTVPLGTPLIVGPAVLTTTLLLIEAHGIFSTLFSVTLNIIIAGATFSFANILIKIIGESGARALSKIMSLLLGAIAVMMIRKGFIGIITLLQ